MAINSILLKYFLFIAFVINLFINLAESSWRILTETLEKTYLNGYENNWTAPLVEPDTKVWPLLDKQMEDSTKLCRSISWTILEFEMCLTVLSEPTE